MAPPRGIKRKSDESVSAGDQVDNAQNMTEHLGANRTGSPSTAQEGPRKRQRTGITLGQKQALIDNLQLEIADRARKLRAQYNLQAQGLRTRIEIRVNRIPMALRKARMGDLADKHRKGQQPQQSKPTPSAFATSVSLPPPVPEKDTPVARQNPQATSHTTTTSSKSGPGRPPKQASDQALRTDQENLGKATESKPIKKKQRGHPAPEAEPVKTSNVLSPSSANVRTLPRTTPGGKIVSRVGANTVTGLSSPAKQSSASNLFSNLAEKARSTRPGASPRKQTVSASTTASSAGGSQRGRNAATATGTGTNKGASTTKAMRRASIISESSEGSTSTVMKKGTTKSAISAVDKEMAPPMSTKKSVMGSIRRGVTGGSKKTTAAKTAAPASTATGRVLRKRA